MSDPFRPGDFGTDALIQHWKVQRQRFLTAAVVSESLLTPSVVSESLHVIDTLQAELSLSGQPATVAVSAPEILIGATLVEKGNRTDEGDIIIAITPVFRRFLRELARDPNAFCQLDPRQAEELVAGAYEEEGWDSVILTPRSGDKGRDVIATSREFGTIRIVDQVKLFSARRVVDAGDVRELYGVLTLDQGASKGFITTTSDFAPGVAKEFAPLIPSRLTLRNGADLRKWLLKFDKS